MLNAEIARIFRDIAAILEIQGENVFRTRAYQRAAQVVESLPDDVAQVAQEDRLTDLPGIGKDLAAHIKEYLATGEMKLYRELTAKVTEGMLELLRIPGVGPKTAKLFFEQGGIKCLADLERALNTGTLLSLPGIKEKTVENIRKGIALVRRGKERMTLDQAQHTADTFIAALKKHAPVDQIAAAGSLRRGKDTVRDVDILVVSKKPDKVMQAFVSQEQVAQVQAHGQTKSSVLLRDDVQVDCRVVEAKSFGAALVYFTGSKQFNIKLRQRAIKQGLKVNEYGVYRGAKMLAGRSEAEVFKALGLRFIEPELREDTGEIEAAEKDTLPKLVVLDDIRGDLHVHSTWSDGGDSIKEMAEACRSRGYAYCAITDHSQGLKIARGLSIDAVRRKRKEIDALNASSKNFTILFGTEVDIDSDGNLDYPDEVLREFDVVVGAIHAGFKQEKEQITKRLVRACRSKRVHVIAHPTGRLWGERDPYEFDFEAVLKACRETGTALEINAHPPRLDLNDAHARAAKIAGVKIAINTDSHAAEQLAFMGLGVSVARRGWLEPDDVLNTLTLPQLRRALRK